MDTRGTWTCPSCTGFVAAMYCSTCGERRADVRDFTAAAIAKRMLRAFSPVDGKVARSFRALLTNPGALTAAFVRGMRRPFMGPFQIFILANILFFFMQSFSDMRLLTAGLDVRLAGQDGGDWARAMVNARLAATGRTLAEYAPVFDQAAAVNAKSLIGLMIPPFAALLPLVFMGRSKPIGVHVIFALHFYAFVLVLLCIPLGLMIVVKMLGGPGVLSPFADDLTAIAIAVICAVYLFVAIKPVYHVRGLGHAARTALLTAAAVSIFLGYRLALLPLTLYTT
ncbi:MAG: DUF3667 domain-containing protein [Proteobacteria bacterium]|nr:DUF3667 domain-containing protein [Pseudomonadota bacterium]